MLEDSVRDAELLERELRHGGISFTARKVDSRADFVEQLNDFDPDLVISDYKLPSFDGMQALGIVRERSQFLPFILVSGYIGEEKAIEALKNGATDFLLKDRLERLVSCVLRALREVEERAEHQRLGERFRLFMESAPNAMVMINSSGLVEMVNGQTEQMFGYSQVEILGQSIEMLFPERFREPHPGPPLAFFAASSSGSAETSSNLFGLRCDAREFPVEIGLHPIETEQGTEVLYIIVDITARRQIEREKDRQRQELEWSNADLEQFASIASHDLNELRRAIGQLAQRDQDDAAPCINPRTAGTLDGLQGQVARLQVLLDGLLVYSRAGLASSSIDDVDIPRLVREIAIAFAPPPGFIVTCVGAMPRLHTFSAPLRVVLEHLIGNGLKHHDRAEGRITVTMRRVNGVAEFRVTDDGPGIEPRFHDRIFVIFQTLAEHTAAGAGGIGLAIARRQVEGHGGRIRVESAPPARGTTFIFTWLETPR